MVKGLDKFQEFFKDYDGHYVIIGGTACDIIIEEAGFNPRATKDIDIVLIIEALSAEFSKQIWHFIEAGKYQQREKSDGEKEYYRFMKPENTEFPYQLELFCRKPDVIALAESARLTPIPLDENLSSLSAILLEEDYYHFMIEHSQVESGLRRANIESLICLKAKAFLEIRERIEKGSKEDSKQLKKHKADVFRLTVMLTPESLFELPASIQAHVNQFAAFVSADLPDKAIFKEMGLSNVNPNTVFEQFKKSFRVNIEKAQ